MDRRSFVRNLGRSLVAGSLWLAAPGCVRLGERTSVTPLPPTTPASIQQAPDAVQSGFLESGTDTSSRMTAPTNMDEFVKDYLHKMEHFDQPHQDDVVLDAREFQLLSSSVNRFDRIQEMVGHGNFYLLSFDEALNAARQFGSVGPFTPAETEFLERIFYTDAARYGFFGEKPLADLTRPLNKKEIIKIPQSGNWLYRGGPQETFDRIKASLGDRVVLTSGVRSIVKQFYLFLSKALRSNGNLSLASRSLAPPGYSFHGIGDFDVGKRGFGADNFTAAFTTTDVFKDLADQGYIVLRYPKGNMLGVRFEPWHIKVGRV